MGREGDQVPDLKYGPMTLKVNWKKKKQKTRHLTRIFRDMRYERMGDKLFIYFPPFIQMILKGDPLVSNSQ